jgi:hypothetical protein
MPLAGVGRCPVVPLLMINAPVDVKLESEEAVNAPVVMLGIVAFVAESKYTARSAGWVQITSLEPAEKLTRLPELLEDSTVFRLSVLPLDVYVPTPTSHSPNDKLEIA